MARTAKRLMSYFLKLVLLKKIDHMKYSIYSNSGTRQFKLLYMRHKKALRQDANPKSLVF